MTSLSRWVGLLSVTLALIPTTGCSNRPTVDIGAPGVTPPDAPKTSEEAIERSRKAEEEARRSGKAIPD